MSYHFDWHNLSPEIRLGQSPDEVVTLYRGFAPHQVDPERGMLSAALLHDRPKNLYEVIKEVASDRDYMLINLIATHAASSDPTISGEYTPFVSATPERDIALRYAQREGGRLATLKVRADQVVTVPLLPYEALVLGSVGTDSIAHVEEVDLVERKKEVPSPYMLAPLNFGNGPLVLPPLYRIDQ